ncbi:MAG: CoA transferase [Alphaproteobacteria bacterium]|nr:CoA transferase [Alphaproteobacteria bacterium]
MTPAPAPPLSGIRVLDLSNVLAGPFCGYQLARQGAEVIKIENPVGGDLARRLGGDPRMNARGMGLSFVAVNVTKRSVAIDLKHAEGREVFLRMVERADVVLENFRPGVMARLGLDYATLAARNPRLVYCAISGFGQEGPWAERPAYDQIIQGLSGAMSVTGDATSAPLRAGFPISDTYGGLTAAFAICAALLEARQSGRGRRIDLALMEATLATMGWVVSNYLNAGIEPRPMGNENFSAAPSGAFATKAGLLNIAANEDKQYRALCDLIGRPDLKTDPRFAERRARLDHRAALNREITAALAARDATEWEELLNAAGVPAGRIVTVPEALAGGQLADRGFVETIAMTGPDGQALRVTRPGFVQDGGFAQPSPPPALGADTRVLLQEHGYDAAAIARLAASGAVKLA